jgi:NAD(P)-dependent dehydrogenase (short-subunit alcohol dehydrogenase family)
MVDLTGRVAIVTGAGRGLGREHALLLAKRGAKVVVNDLGGSVTGSGQSSAAAEAVAREIQTAGGEAIANACSVSDADGVNAMVADAAERWGGVDILVHNAGIVRDRAFSEMTLDDFRVLLDVHLVGGFLCAKAVWGHMVAKSYGRIVLTTSASGLFGTPKQANYAAAKMGLVGMMQVLSQEGARHNIRVNGLAPSAATRMFEEAGGRPVPEVLAQALQAGAVSPGVLALVAEDAPNRTILCAGSGSFEQANITLTQGIHIEPCEDMDDRVLASLEAIGDRTSDFVPQVSGEAVYLEMRKAGLDFMALSGRG